MLNRVGDIDIDENLPIQRAVWRLQKIGWAFAIALLIASVVGLTGPGWLSRGTVEAAGGSVTIHHYRLARQAAPVELTLRLSAKQLGDGETVIWLNQAFTQHYKIEAVLPQPKHAALSDDGTLFFFASERRTSEVKTILFRLMPQSPGFVAAELKIEGGPRTSFYSFVYP